MYTKQIDITKYKNKGYTGLVNLGNTCFLNSTIQVLNHTYELVELLNSQKTQSHMKRDLSDYSILKEWLELVEIMMTNHGVVSPNKFVYHVHKLAREKDREIFTGWAQNDITEFILFIMESLHNTISRSVNMKIHGDPKTPLDELAVQCYTMMKTIYTKEYSELMDLFYGIYISEICSLDKKIIYVTKPEQFFILDLPIPMKTNITLYDCFQFFTQYENMYGDNAWYNEKRNIKESVHKRITFWNMPHILVITLKRFSPDGNYKINEIIDFPITNLDLSAYISGYNPKKYVYDLYGVCNHSGSVMGGHYTSFVKNASNEWIHYNDSSIQVIKDQKLVVSPLAYCLFYRKKNS